MNSEYELGFNAGLQMGRFEGTSDMKYDVQDIIIKKWEQANNEKSLTTEQKAVVGRFAELILKEIRRA